MTIRHHLPDDLLLAYAAANLAEGWSLAVATHLTLCPACRQREAQLAAIGGATLEEFAPQAVGATALADVLSRLDGEPAEPVIEAAPGERSVLPKPLLDYTGGDAGTLQWSFIGVGMRQHILKLSGGVSARLLHVREGMALPEHGHRGLEMTLVLAGSFTDAGREFRRGDVSIADEEVQHIQVIGHGEPCICLTVTDAPLVFNGWLPRIAQRFAKI